MTGDFNGDGRLDLAVTDARDDTVSVLLGNGDGTFQPRLIQPSGRSRTRWWRGTSTATGDLDLAVANGPPIPSRCCSATATALSPPVIYAVGYDPTAIVAGDFNGDGHLDLAVANGADNTVSVLLGNGDGTFQPQGT